jgi:hypothetical protein
MFNEPPRPYKIWHADLWVCPQCLHQIVSGYGSEALLEHFQEGFDEYLENVKAAGGIVIYQYER